MKYLILYNYFESDRSVKNLEFFVKHALIDDPSYQFCFIIKGSVCSVPIPKKSNIQVIHDINEGFDFAGWRLALDKNNINNFDHFIFINSSALGPFIPRYLPRKITWAYLFTSKLSDKIKLVGSTINYFTDENPWYPKDAARHTHIQSYAFATDLVGLKLLLKSNVFSRIPTQIKLNVIITCEVQLTNVITKHGYDIFVFQYSENRNSHIHTDDHHDNIHFPGAYYKTTLNPIEIMFIKSNLIYDQTVENYYAWKNISEPRDIFPMSALQIGAKYRTNYLKHLLPCNSLLS